MGYVNPSYEPRDFEDQFEWDGHGWLFRRFHRARPVRVSPDEMDQSISFYHRWKRTILISGTVSWVLLTAAWNLLAPEQWQATGRPVEGMMAIGIGAALWLARNWVWRRAVERFGNRVPVGPGQSWIEDRKAEARSMGWGDLLPSAAYAVFVACMVWFLPFDTGRVFEYAVVSFVGLASLFDIWLKWRASQT